VDGLRMDESKTQTIQNWPTLHRVKNVQSFLGFANFYRHFIDNYAEITSPLHLTWKNEPWSWTTDCQVAFDNIKEAFTTAPILGHWDPESLMILETDASDHALAAILSTRSNGEICPIAFHSRAFSAAEINYDVHNKELLAIVESFKKWRHYLEGVATPVEVYTDHRNLTYFSETKTLSRRLARWSEFLSQFNLSIKFWLGRLGKKPDALTRRWDIYGDDPSKDFPIQKPVFIRTQLMLSEVDLGSQPLTLQAAIVTDLQSLISDIKEAQKSDQSHMYSLMNGGTTEDLR